MLKNFFECSVFNIFSGIRYIEENFLQISKKFKSSKEGLSPKETSDLMMQTDPSEICHAEEASLLIPKK